MTEVAVLTVRMDNAEADIRRHEILIERIADMQGEMKTGLTEVATELKVTNGLIERNMGMQQMMFGLLAMLASALGIGTQVM